MAAIGTDLDKVTGILDKGGLVAIPTETVYGLAAKATNEEAVLRIFKAKNRPSFDPLICHTDSLEKIMAMVKNVSNSAHKLASHFWPGPLTLLLPKDPMIPDLVTSGLPTVAVRIPRHAMTLDLLSRIDYPLAAPSANPFGYISPTRPQHVADQLGEEVDYILDGGDAQVGVESTIVSVTDEGLVVHRLGGLSVEEIEDVAGSKAYLSINNSSNPSAPGMLKSHYAPKSPLVIGDIPALLEKYKDRRVGVLSFEKAYATGNEQQFVLSRTGDLAEAAKNLFSALRTMDYASLDVILAEFVPDQGLGRAVNDRLRRAAVK